MNRTLKFDNYKVVCKEIDAPSNYKLSVHVFKDKELIGGTIMKPSTDIKVLEYAFQVIENKKGIVVKNLFQV
jgi:hypothetical protein